MLPRCKNEKIVDGQRVIVMWLTQQSVSPLLNDLHWFHVPERVSLSSCAFCCTTLSLWHGAALPIEDAVQPVAEVGRTSRRFMVLEYE